MSTSATIAIELDDGTYLARRVIDYGGEKLAAVLSTQFDTPLKAREFVWSGDELAISPEGEIDWRGTDWGPRVFKNLGDLMASIRTGAHHLHIYNDGWELRLNDEAQWQNVLADMADPARAEHRGTDAAFRSASDLPKANAAATVTAATVIADAMVSEIRAQPTETRTAIARSIEAAVAADQPLDAAFVARTVWNMTRGTHSRAYEKVMPDHGLAISRVAAFQTHPDDLTALARNGWSTFAGDIPIFSRVIAGTEWQMTPASGKWDLTRAEANDVVRHKVLTTSTADAAIKAVEEQTGRPSLMTAARAALAGELSR